jgi:hypothetical protein
MICALVFHVIGTSETILMSWLFAVARGAHVPIFHIKAAREAHVLIGERFDDVGEIWVLLPERWLDARGDVRDDASVTNVWDGGGHRGAATYVSAFAMSTAVVTTPTASSTTLRRIEGLLPETMEGWRGIDLGRRGHIRIVACRGGICHEHCHLLHQCLLLLMELCIVSGELLEGCIDLGRVGAKRLAMWELIVLAMISAVSLS